VDRRHLPISSHSSGSLPENVAAVGSLVPVAWAPSQAMVSQRFGTGSAPGVDVAGCGRKRYLFPAAPLPSYRSLHASLPRPFTVVGHSRLH